MAKKNAVLEAILEICGIGYYFFKNETILLALSIVVIADVILIGITGRLVMKAEKRKAGTNKN